MIECGVMTFPGSWHIDPQPPEFCEVQVEDEGDRCPEHEEQDDE